jgi:hypothetical protein
VVPLALGAATAVPPRVGRSRGTWLGSAPAASGSRRLGPAASAPAASGSLGPGLVRGRIGSLNRPLAPSREGFLWPADHRSMVDSTFSVFERCRIEVKDNIGATGVRLDGDDLAALDEIISDTMHLNGFILNLCCGLE